MPRAIRAASPRFHRSPLFASARHYRVSLIVASALFMENLDSTIILTALPEIARSLNVEILHLNLAVTAYLLSLAVFIPLSGWVADRFGSRNVFRVAIGIFTIASVLCAAAESAPMLVAARVLQGMGGAMMSPVGRLIILRAVPKSELVPALAYLTIPALIGPVLGPPLGGFISTYFSWHWIFLINVPLGVVSIWLATRYMDDVRETDVPKLDLRGSVLAGLGLAGLVFGFETIDRGIVPVTVTVGLLALGALCMTFYVLHARITPHPIVELRLLKILSFRWTIIGGFIFRITSGAVQVMMPLMLQVGFGMNAFASGMLVFAVAVGAIPMKAWSPYILRRFGFRRVMAGAALLTAAIVAGFSGFSAATPAIVIFVILTFYGFVRSIQYTSMNALAYADVDAPDMSKATSFVSMNQQLSMSVGAAVAGFVMQQAIVWRGGTSLGAADFPPAFAIMAASAAVAALCFLRLGRGAGSEISGRRRKAVAAPKDEAE
jgi:EmrB/QacA subfamily drug resistance transporter